MRNQKYYLDLFSNINFNFINFNYFSFKFFLLNYLTFLNEKENLEVLSKVCDSTKFFLFGKKYFFENFDIDEYHKVSIMGLFIFKCLSKNSLNESIYSVNYSNSDTVLNEIINCYKNINIFYKSKECTHQEIHSIRGDLFKIIKHLILDSVVICKNNYYKNRTVEEWTFGNKNIKISETEHLKLLDEKPRIIIVNENFYCVGNFFIFVKKIFIENNKSEYFFKLNDANYINNMSNLEVNININDLKLIVDVLNEEFFSENDINACIEKNNKNIKNNLIEIKKIKKDMRKDSIEEAQSWLTNVLKENSINILNINNLEKENKKKLEKIYIEKFLDFSKNFIKNNSESLNIKDDVLLKIIFYFFTKNFKNAYVKTEAKNEEELNKIVNDFDEFGVDLGIYIKNIKQVSDLVKEIKINNKTENLKNKNKLIEEILEENENFKEIVDENFENNKKEKIKIESKIDPTKVPLMLYLVLLKKKEVEDILKDMINEMERYKKNEDIESFLEKEVEKKKLKNNFDSFLVEKDDNINNYFNIGCSIFIKFNNKKNSSVYKQMKKIEELEDLNKKFYAEISKISHIKDIYILNNHITKNELFKKKIDKFNNIKIFFMFFFDFRGRFYYDSPISPTSNRFCRFIYNYGVIKKNKIEITENKISKIIEKKKNFINNVKEYFEISEDSNFIDNSIFWVLISIGKIKIDKSKVEINIDEFLKIGIKIIKKEIILKDKLDIVEYNYYTKIINNLKEEDIIKRCLVKDATASFFQNLIRILGAKDKESEKIANLNSEENWYDWYTYILNSWKEKKEKNELDYLFTRKTIKKVAMTFPYSASYITCLEYFTQGVFENFEINIKKNTEAINMFKDFYRFIKNIMLTEGPFKKSTESINEYFNKTLEKGEPIIIISKNEDLTNLTYYKTKTKHFDFIIKWNGTKKRIIKNYMIIDKNQIDKRKTNSALKANLVHFVDALLIRDINWELFKTKKTHYLSVHDSFLVNFIETSNFIIITNQCFNKDVFKNEIWENEKNFFSIFIFL